jgi:hypothetical protein
MGALKEERMTTRKPIDAAQRAADAALAQARLALGDLSRERIAAVARQGELEQRRQELAYEGLRGSAADRRALGDASAESARLTIELENLGFAIAAAQKRVSAAEAAVERAGVRSRAIEAQGRVAELRAAGSACAQHLSEFLVQYSRLMHISADIRRSGAGRWPRDEVWELSIRRSLQFALAPHHLNSGPLDRPGDRRDLAATLEHWFSELEIDLERRLEPDDTEEAA